MKKNIVSSPAASAKERMINVLKVDRQHIMTAVIKEPLQPYLEFMMDVAAYAISEQVLNDVITIQNKQTGLRFQIKKLLQEDSQRNTYEVKLFNNNELRFSAHVINSSMLPPNQWYFTNKYEDLVSIKDVAQFIKATSILYAKLKTDRITTPGQLIGLALLLLKPGVKSYKFDDNIRMNCVWNGEDQVSEIRLSTNDITLMTCSARKNSEGLFEIENENIVHELPMNVLSVLADQIRPLAKDVITNSVNKQNLTRQNDFYKSREGVIYQEQAQLNDIFKGYRGA